LKIGIDIQALQTEGSKNRGIGRYTRDLFSNILKLDSKDEFTFFVNSYYSSKIDLPKNPNTKFQEIKFVNEKSNGTNTRLNELAQFFQFYISNQEIIHIASPFEGWPYKYSVINRYSPRLNAALVTTLFDLIPLVFSKEYLTTYEVRKYYYQRLSLLKQCDLIFSISEATRQDAINLLNIEPSKIVNIGSAAGNSFKKIDVPEIEKQKIRKKFSITDYFVLYTGGIDFRKNIERTIEAFSKIDKSLIEKYSFVIVCKIEPFQKEALLKVADNFGIKNKIILTGFIPDSDLNILYNICDLFIFPSLYEGAGLPILEAMRCGAPVISSNTSSMVELLLKKEYMFNPYDVDEISMKLAQVLKDDQFKNNLKQYCINRGKQFSWEKSARIALDEYNKLDDIIKEKKRINGNLGLKSSLAYFTSLPPLKSGIAEYSKRLLPSLVKHYDIDVFTDDYTPSEDLTFSINCIPVDKFENYNSLENYDHTLYHMGNSDHHFFMFDILKKNKGIIVLHDLFLAPMQYVYSQQKDITENSNSNKENFLNDIIYSHGKLGEKYVSQFKDRQISIDKIFDDLPMIKKFLDSSSGIIVHSNWSKNKIQKMYPDFKNIKIVNFNSPQLLISDKTKTRRELGFSENEFLIGSFGIVGSTKRLDIILKNLKNFLQQHKNSRYIIAGYMDDVWKSKISKIIRELKLEDKVTTVGFVDFELYKKYLSIVDVCINLRYPTRGETSSSMFDLLRAGIPTIVSNEGPLGELPDDCVIKVNANDEKRLEEILSNLENSPQLRENLSNNAQLFSSKEGNLDRCTLQYDSAIKFFENGRENEIKNNLENRLVKFVSKELSLSSKSKLDEDSLDFISGLMCEAINSKQD